MTEVIVVERTFETPCSVDELQAREDAVAWCLEQHAVQAVCSYVALDGRAVICMYRAPDAEAVRVTQRQGGLPVEHAWAAAVHGARTPPAAGAITIIVQREFPAPVTMLEIEQIIQTRGHCLELYRVVLHASHLARDGRRMLCVFTAPDAESVRLANRQMELPVSRAWPARVHLAPACPPTPPSRE